MTTLPMPHYSGLPINIPKLNCVTPVNFKCDFEDTIAPEQLSSLLLKNSPGKIEFLIQQKNAPLVLENSKEESARSPHLQIEEVFIQVHIQHTDYEFRSFLGKTKSGFYFAASGVDEEQKMFFVVSKNLNILFKDFCAKNSLDHKTTLVSYNKNKLDKQLPPKDEHSSKMKI